MVQTYIMSGMKSDFTTKYSPPISLDESKQYEAALLSIDLFNSIPNITNLNIVFKYSKDNGNSWVNIELDTGSYELSAISNEIQRLMAKQWRLRSERRQSLYHYHNSKLIRTEIHCSYLE